MIIDYKIIGERIKERRIQLKMTQSELAEKMDISVPYLSRIERGISDANLKRLSEIATYLEVTIEYLLTGTVVKEKNYLDKDLYNILMQCTSEQQRLIYNIAKIVSTSKFI